MISKPRIFKYQHIRIEIRPPTGKEFDIQDEYDRQQFVDKLWKEWKMAKEEVEATFNIVKLDEEKAKFLP